MDADKNAIGDKKVKTQLTADLMLVGVTFCWGSSCLVTKLALDDLQEFNLIAVRFLIGFIFAFIILFKKLIFDKKVLFYSAILAINYFITVALMTFGVQHTTVSKSGLLTCLAGVFIPIINVVIFRKKVGKKIAFCAALTLVGVYMLTMAGSNENLNINIGDILSTLCSLFFAIQVMLVGYMVQRTHIITLTVLQMGFVSLYNLIASFIFETPHIPTTAGSWLAMFWLGLICGVIAMLLQNIAQKNTSDTHAGIIFTLEPVFALILAYIFLGEILTFTGYLGAAIILLCIVALEVDFSKFFKRSGKSSTG